MLEQLTKRIQSVFRPSDYIIRWAGVKFVAIAKFIEKKEVPILAQIMLDMVNTISFNLAENKMTYQSCSTSYVIFTATLNKKNSLHCYLMYQCPRITNG
jgi:GGDEF domain-containing protein